MTSYTQKIEEEKIGQFGCIPLCTTTIYIPSFPRWLDVLYQCILLAIWAILKEYTYMVVHRNHSIQSYFKIL